MKREWLFSTGSRLAVMVLLPWLTVRFAPADGGMALCFLLFFAVDPLYALADGWKAGKKIRSRWWYPAATALSFLLGAWTVFDPGEPAFCVYALVYGAIGYAALGVSAILASTKAPGGR